MVDTAIVKLPINYFIITYTSRGAHFVQILMANNKTVRSSAAGRKSLSTLKTPGTADGDNDT